MLTAVLFARATPPPLCRAAAASDPVARLSARAGDEVSVCVPQATLRAPPKLWATEYGGHALNTADVSATRTPVVSRSLLTFAVCPEFLVFLEFMETSEVAGPGPNPREIEISFGADGPLACARPDPTIGRRADVLPLCSFVFGGGILQPPPFSAASRPCAE